MMYTFKTEDAEEALFITNMSNIRSCLHDIIHNLGRQCDYMEDNGTLDADNVKLKIVEYTEKIQHLYE